MCPKEVFYVTNAMNEMKRRVVVMMSFFYVGENLEQHLNVVIKMNNNLPSHKIIHTRNEEKKTNTQSKDRRREKVCKKRFWRNLPKESGSDRAVTMKLKIDTLFVSFISILIFISRLCVKTWLVFSPSIFILYSSMFCRRENNLFFWYFSFFISIRRVLDNLSVSVLSRRLAQLKFHC